MVLVDVPWSVMLLDGGIFGKTLYLPQACFDIVLLAGGGLVFFAIALLISSLVEGEYTAPIVSYGIVIAIAVALSDQSLRAFSPWSFIMGDGYYDRHTSLLVGPIPWMHVVVYGLLAAILTGVSVKLTQRLE